MGGRNDPVVQTRWRAYDKNGVFKGVVLLTSERRAKYEEMGYTFKPNKGAQWSRNF